MLTLIALLCLTGLFLIYQTSKRAKLNHNAFLELWPQSHLKKSRALGVSFLVITLGLAVYHWGISAGIMAFLVLAMCLQSLLLLLPPLRYLTYKTLGVLLIVSLISELILS